MTWENSVIAILVIGILTLFMHLFEIIELKRTKRKKKISFKETIALTDLPIVTFYNNGNKLNFILDTGSNRSVLNSEELDICKYRKLHGTNSLHGVDGITREVSNIELTLMYDDKEYVDIFQVTDLSDALNKLFEDTGIKIHGVLGNTFFTKYRSCVDFDTASFCTKK